MLESVPRRDYDRGLWELRHLFAGLLAVGDYCGRALARLSFQILIIGTWI